MKHEKLLICKILSHLLQFPDENLLNSLDTLRQVISELPQSRDREVLTGFLGYLQGQKVVRLQEDYSRHFDLNPATCLNLTYHRCGDGKDRGAALAALVQVYRQAGYETVTGELPDYLPLVLEFLSICPAETHTWLVREYQSQVEVLASRLHQTGGPYAHLLAVIQENFRD